MLTLSFNGLGFFSNRVAGAATVLRFTGNFIRDAGDGSIVARYCDHTWKLDGLHYTGFDLGTPVVIHFEDFEGLQSESFGTFTRLRFADGAMYADEKPFAKLNSATLLWHCYGQDTYWPILVMTDGEQS